MFDIFQKFICKVKQQLEKKLKYIQIGFKKIFTNQVFKKYIAKKKIK